MWPNGYSQTLDIFLIHSYNRALPIVQWMEYFTFLWPWLAHLEIQVNSFLRLLYNSIWIIKSHKFLLIMPCIFTDKLSAFQLWHMYVFLGSGWASTQEQPQQGYIVTVLFRTFHDHSLLLLYAWFNFVWTSGCGKQDAPLLPVWWHRQCGLQDAG